MPALDFEVRVGAGDGRALRVEVIGSPAGEGSATSRFPYDTLALENRLQALQLALLSGASRRRRAVPDHERVVQEFGRELFESVFTGEVQSLLERSREQAVTSGSNLRIQLRFDSAELASLPWEFLFDPSLGEYVCLSSATPLVRYVELAQPQRPLRVDPPLRILAMVAGPSDLAQLDVDQERARVDAALGSLVDAGRVELTWLEGQTWRHLQSALQSSEWHVFHLVAHGGFDATRGEGVVAFCGDDDRSYLLGATDLGRLLGDHASLRLAMLNACEGARSDRLDVFSSTAAVLVKRGTPAVIAMQYEITDLAAVELSRSFYGAVAAGMPVDVALGEARKAVALASPGTLEWGTPVLYLRAPDGRIFDLDPATLPPAPSADPRPQPPAAHREPTGGVGGVERRPPAASSRLATFVRARWPILAGVVGLLVVGVLAVALLTGGDDKGMGLHALAVDEDGGITTHGFEIPRDSVALVTVRPVDRRMDPDVGVVARRDDARRLAALLEPVGFDLRLFAGAFDEYDGPRVGQVVARVDENGTDQAERLVVVVPFGGSFEVVVAGAAETRGAFELEIRRIEVRGSDDPRRYLDRVLDDGRIRGHLSEEARAGLEANAAVNLPKFELDEAVGTDEGAPFDVEGLAELLAAFGLDDAPELDDDFLSCVAGWISDTASAGEKVSPDDPAVAGAVDACAPSTP